MFSRIKRLSGSFDTLHALFVQKAFKLLPDHLYALSHGIGILISMLQGKMEISENREKCLQYVLLATTGSTQLFLAHPTSVVV